MVPISAFGYNETVLSSAVYEANLTFLATLHGWATRYGTSETAKFFDLDLSQAEAIVDLEPERVEHLAKHSDLPLWALNIRLSSLPAEQRLPPRSVRAMFAARLTAANEQPDANDKPLSWDTTLVVEANTVALRALHLFLAVNGPHATAACFGAPLPVVARLGAMSPIEIDRVGRESVYSVCRLNLSGQQIRTVQCLELRHRRSMIATMLRANALARTCQLAA